jgi:CubicO group peptidase (beta-lactamase class C family)
MIDRACEDAPVDARTLGRRVGAWVRAARAPGLSAVVVRDGEVAYARGFGTTSVEDAGLPVTPETLFHIASTTKPLTGTAILRLVERGLLDLDRPVRAYLPRLRLDAGAAERVTLRRLLSHTAGLPAGRYRPVGARAAGALGRWARRSLPRCRLAGPPDTAYRYSNPGISLAGYVAEVVTGAPFAELMQELVFDPLEMRRTTFDPTVAMTYPVALGHYDDERGDPRVVHQFPVDAAAAPAGFAISTATDLANFAAVHLGRGCFRGAPFLRPESVAAMHAPQVATGRDRDDGYGLTFGTDRHDGVRVVEHDGEGGWSTSQFVLAPDRGLGVIVLCNAYRADLTVRVASYLLDAALAAGG